MSEGQIKEKAKEYANNTGRPMEIWRNHPACTLFDFEFAVNWAQNELKKRVIDLVDFEEWKIENGWQYKSEVNMWRNKKGIVIVESPTSPLYINTERLLQIYINSKTK